MTTSIREIIKQRRTIRNFNNEVISLDTIIEMLRDATWAPNHKLREPWRFVLFHGDGKEKLRDILLQSSDNIPSKKIEKFTQAQANIVVIMPENTDPLKQEEDLSAVAALIQNFLLLAWENKIGVLWKTGKLIHNSSFQQSVGIGENEKIVGILMVGKFDNVPEAQPREDIVEKITIID
ncbi:nitroreductase family protein [Priestia filamentosa]|uniref:nitroreductase family protein n=1 Tax=Priestia filamentosa TaxID=1402861 RepID=UPI00234A422A|nr:nitroreductase [Priestia filamentosa]WCM14040.1 nitroreductase [Priestia filamentosa]